MAHARAMGSDGRVEESFSKAGQREFLRLAKVAVSAGWHVTICNEKGRLLNLEAMDVSSFSDESEIEVVPNSPRERQLMDLNLIQHTNRMLPLPSGVTSLEHWGDTRVTLPKYADKGMTFSMLAQLGAINIIGHKYNLYILRKYLSLVDKTVTDDLGFLRLAREPENQAQDYALFLGVINYESRVKQSSYQRTFAYQDR